MTTPETPTSRDHNTSHAIERQISLQPQPDNTIDQARADYEAARKKAHEAPHGDDGSNAWARWANEAMRAKERLDALLGLSAPASDPAREALHEDIARPPCQPVHGPVMEAAVALANRALEYIGGGQPEEWMDCDQEIKLLADRVLELSRTALSATASEWMPIARERLAPGEQPTISKTIPDLVCDGLRFADRVSVMLNELAALNFSDDEIAADERLSKMHELLLRRFSDCSGLALFLSVDHLRLGLPADLFAAPAKEGE